MTQHVMIDLETWGKGPSAQIISIGAVKFDPTEPEGPFDNFHVAINPAFGTKAFRDLFEVDPATVMWWMSKDRTLAREHWLSCEKLDLPSALVGFGEWFGSKSLPTWGNGATFDNVILLHALQACSFDRPWSYRDDRCYRTLRAEWPQVPWLTDREAAELLVSAPLNGLDIEGVPHTALYDAQVQAIHLRRIYAAKARDALSTRRIEEGSQDAPSAEHKRKPLDVRVSYPAPNRVRIEAFETPQQEMNRLMEADLPPAEREPKTMAGDWIEKNGAGLGFEPAPGVLEKLGVDPSAVRVAEKAGDFDPLDKLGAGDTEENRAEVLSVERIRRKSDAEIAELIERRRGCSPLDPTLMNLLEVQQSRRPGRAITPMSSARIDGTEPLSTLYVDPQPAEGGYDAAARREAKYRQV